ncbi:MAG: CZB domain-containing protein [Hydrogenophilales bacterium]|nr:CZB domain-containing protein [Hydrogenophilales bacterium]
MGLKEDIEAAIHAHGAWKARFRDFLNGKSALDLSSVGVTNACKLGHWIEAEGQHLLSPNDYEEVNRLHTDFHLIAGEVVRKIKQKDFAGAHQDIASDGPLDQASKALTVYLLKATSHSSPKSKAPMAPDGAGTSGGKT